MTKKLTLPIVALTGAMALSGCQIMPTFFKPAAPVPSMYPEGDSTATKSVGDIGWNEFFQNPDLREDQGFEKIHSSRYRQQILSPYCHPQDTSRARVLPA